MDYFNQCFVLKEPEVHTEQNSLSVAQMKARRIIESFENPFRMVGNVKSLTFTILYLCFGRIIIYCFLFQYLPSTDVHVNKNAKFDPSSKIFEVPEELFCEIY